jgi:endonuclease G
MKRVLILFIVLTACLRLYSQKVDTIINQSNYFSYYSYSVKNPLYVVYHLYKGGGDCSRKGMNFMSDSATAKNKDYSKSGYDKGHLANAEDFAYDCDQERKTFSFYNCQPQTPKLNRGIWKVWETKVRKESQSEHLKIICGGIFSDSTFIGDSVYIPKYCWKIVINEADDSIIHCLIFPNDDSDSFEEISLSELRIRVKYNLAY